MISTRVASVLLVVPLLGAAACGSSAKKVDPAADLATAKAAVLTAADVAGYAGSPHTDSGDLPAAVKKEFATCMKTVTTVFDDIPGAQKAHSPDLNKGDAQVTNSVEIDPKRSDIDTGWSVLSKTGTETCLARLFESAAKASVPPNTNGSVGTATVTRFDVGIGDRSVGYSVKLPITAAGHRAVAYIDFIFVARDRAGIELDFENVDAAPLDRATQIVLARTVYDRVGAKAS